MRKLPRSLSIAGVKWDLQVKEESEDEEVCFGATERHQRVISIYTAPHAKFPKNDMRSTLFHECLHAALASTGLDEAMGGCEEAVVTALETALWPLIRSGLFTK